MYPAYANQYVRTHHSLEQLGWHTFRAYCDSMRFNLYDVLKTEVEVDLLLGCRVDAWHTGVPLASGTPC